MNKKILSTSLSLACHSVFLIVAFGVVWTTPSQSAPEAPLLIHVHLDSRPFSPSMGTTAPKPTAKALAISPVKIHKIKKATGHPLLRKNIISKNPVISAVRKEAPVMRQNTAPVPAAAVADQNQPPATTPSLEPPTEEDQGEAPYLPFSENGVGTDIRSFMGYRLETYEDPDDHLKYFKLSIQVEEIPGTLPALAKEMIFIIDASNSIGQELLNHFGLGAIQCLRLLNERDKFNIIVFNDHVRKMRETAVDNTIENIQQAQAFLSDLKSRSTTDLYETVLESIRNAHAMKPSYLFLISDGEPTVGVTDPVQIINQIAQINNGRVPIFGLGAGFPNKYFMNFIAFTNHGWSEFGPPITADEAVIQLYNHIKDPVLTDLRYFSIGLNAAEIYPKLLPDLFKGSEFVLYGKYGAERNFMLQLRGNSGKDIKQYVIKDTLNNGQPGDRTIAEQWAIRKVFHLIGHMQYNQNNQALIDEVNELASKFNLKIPAYKAS